MFDLPLSLVFLIWHDLGMVQLHRDLADFGSGRYTHTEREGDQTHSYWYIPSAPRVNYSLLVMDSARMMKMATGDGNPAGRLPEQGPDWFLVAIEACGGGTPDLSSVLEVLGYVELYRRKKHVRGATRAPRGRGARPHPRVFLVPLLTWVPSPSGGFPSKNNFSS